MSAFYDITEPSKKDKDLKIYLIEIFEIASFFLIIGIIIRSFVFESALIKNNSMKNTLIKGDRIFINKYIYGPLVPFTKKRMFNLFKPSINDIVVFTDINNNEKLLILRCIAKGGDTLKIIDKKPYINNNEYLFPQSSSEKENFIIEKAYSPRDNFSSFIIPKKNDTVYLDSVTLRDFDFYINIIRQENSGSNIYATSDLVVDGKINNNYQIKGYNFKKFDNKKNPDFDEMNWIELNNILNYLKIKDKNNKFHFKRTLYLNNKKIDAYKIKTRLYFLIGDNWDKSMDSRYFGPISIDKIYAKGSCIYFSKTNNKINWNRILVFI